MKIFPITSNRPNAAKKHFDFFNQQCNSLMQFKHQFQPGFKILNESPVIYTYEELVNKGVLKKAKLPHSSSKVDSLIVVASKLSYGEGVINTFPYTHVYVFFGEPESLSQPPYSIVDDVVQIPASVLPGEEAAFTKSQLYLNNQLIFTDSDNAEGTLQLYRDSNNQVLNKENLLLKKYSPNYKIYGFVDKISEEAPSDSVLEELESSAYIISAYLNEKGYSLNNENQLENLDLDTILDKRNYLIARLARGGGYYVFSYTTFEEENELVLGANFTYQPEATDVMGLKYVIDGDPRQKRFLAPVYYDLFIPKVSSATAISFIDSDQEIISQIKTSNGGVWGGNNLLNHEFYLSTNNKVESFIADDVRNKKTAKLNKISTPAYQVDFNNNYGLTPIFVLW